MHPLGRLVDSLRKRGIRRTLQSAGNIIDDHLFDVRYGTDTVRRVSQRRLRAVSDNQEAARDYVPTRGRAFRALLRALGASPQTVFIDFGCGKGKLLLLAGEFGCRRIVGVEFSPELCAIARENARRYYGRADRVEVVCCDAVDYAFRDDENLLFLFNPFSGRVMSALARNVERSYRRRPRPMSLVYNDPVWWQVIECESGFRRTRTLAQGGHDFLVFERFPDA
jgi:SAM-dependent methyltransferase